MSIEQYEERAAQILEQMNRVERFSAEWASLEKQRMKAIVKIGDLKRKAARDSRFIKQQKTRELINVLKTKDQGTPEHEAILQQLVNL